ncbi:MAG: transporter substrate-binding domain-containing protein [Oscillospiraceae bacterium]|jgi:L-cystine transport system substrate-binding protein|nr:transporter substrate-binding domain-containing protein [Oscillospiraceae bacterium]
MKRLVSILLVVTFLFALAACGASGGASPTPTAASGASAAPSATPAAVTYVVGTSGSFAPFCFTDTDGTLTGYDVEVLRAVDERLEDVSFTFKTFDFDGLFLGLDGGSIDFITHQLGKNAERESKYLYANEPLGFTSMSIATRAEDTDINNVKDLEGRSILITATGVPNTWLTKYNEETAETPVVLEYYEGDWVQGMQLVVSGSSDATAAPAVNIDTAIKDMGLAVRRAPDPLYTVDVFFIYAKTHTALRDRIDAVLKELKADGTLSAISRQFLGDDYTSLT